MYAISTWTYINHKNQTNVGKYTIHGRYGKLLKTNIENKHIPKSSRNSRNLLGWGQAFHRPRKAALWPLTYIPSWSSLNPVGVQKITCLLEGNNMFTLLATPIHITQWLSDQAKLLQEAMVLNNTTGALYKMLWFQCNYSNFQARSIHPKMALARPFQPSHQGRSRSFFQGLQGTKALLPIKGGLSGNKTGHRFILDSSLRGWDKDHVFFCCAKMHHLSWLHIPFFCEKHTEQHHGVLRQVCDLVDAVISKWLPVVEKCL